MNSKGRRQTMSKQKNESLFWGFLVLLIGILFLIKNLGWAEIDIWEFIAKFWPVILIYIGLKNIIIYILKRR
jgi:lia operon protein LiaF